MKQRLVRAPAELLLAAIPNNYIKELLRRKTLVHIDVMNNDLWRTIGDAIQSSHMTLATASCSFAFSKLAFVKFPRRFLIVSSVPAELETKSPGRWSDDLFATMSWPKRLRASQFMLSSLDQISGAEGISNGGGF